MIFAEERIVVAGERSREKYGSYLAGSVDPDSLLQSDSHLANRQN